MSIAEPLEPASLLSRARGIVLSPSKEWLVIRTEETTIRQLFLGYACILAVLPAIAIFLQLTLFRHWALLPDLIFSTFSYFLSLLGILLQGSIFNILAPSFGGQRSFIQATKAAVYSQTVGCIAGIATVIPFLGFVILVAGIYGLYTLWVGLPRLMKVPADKAVGYLIANILLSIVVNIAIVVIITILTSAAFTFSGVR